jgi:hypothetical protein
MLDVLLSCCSQWCQHVAVTLTLRTQHSSVTLSKSQRITCALRDGVMCYQDVSVDGSAHSVCTGSSPVYVIDSAHFVVTYTSTC